MIYFTQRQLEKMQHALYGGFYGHPDPVRLRITINKAFYFYDQFEKFQLSLQNGF